MEMSPGLAMCKFGISNQFYFKQQSDQNIIRKNHFCLTSSPSAQDDYTKGE